MAVTQLAYTKLEKNCRQRLGSSVYERFRSHLLKEGEVINNQNFRDLITAYFASLKNDEKPGDTPDSTNDIQSAGSRYGII